MLFRPVFLQILTHFLNQKTEHSTAVINQSTFTKKPKVLKPCKKQKYSASP